MIEKIRVDDIQEIAHIHYTVLKEELLSQFGLGFLRVFYKAIFVRGLGFGFACKKDGKIAGFIVATCDGENLRKIVLRAGFFPFCHYIFLKIIKNPEIIYDVLSLVFYKMPKLKNELLSFCVLSEHQRQGVGRALLDFLIDYYKNSNISSFDVIVGDTRREAKEFYMKNDFINICQFAVGQRKYNLLRYRLNERIS